MAIRDKQRNGTLNAMQRVWARQVLKQQALEQGKADSIDCKEAREYLKQY
ncbi:hypothetical protein Lepto7376_1229 [[Leptolyngbya] sp. PCC 7376]|nr:hypothetical protein [[Leptolyngbya] sp. PCC 7376]AFY37585.1 hypothetical protein Lepto7376_1229 [[Leptolyngbya] sp. PCC 7376]